MGVFDRSFKPGSSDSDDNDDQATAGQIFDAAVIGEVDDLLDEIDEVLEKNAEEFVRGYVQKGGE